MSENEAMAAAIQRQEAALVLPVFSEDVAFAIGSAVRQRAIRDNLPICIDIHLWDRQLFFCALPGAQAVNQVWARRKSWIVRNRGRSSYRAVFENKGERQYGPNWALDPALYALAGGAFPIAVQGAGIIGAIAISGVHERDDHQLGADALGDHLGLDRSAIALPQE